MININNHVFEVAQGYLGLKEYPGASKHNPEIVKMFAASGHSWVQDDETAWCSAFTNAVLAQSGIKGTMKLNARSWLDWGVPVDIKKAQKGDIVVFWRGSQDSWKGHVAFYSHHDEDYVYVLGGNQGNSVSLKPYARSRLLGVRTYKQPRTSVVQSKTAQVSATQAVTAVTGGMTAVSQLEGNTQIVMMACCAVVAIGALFVFKERLKKWADGDR